MSRQKPAFLGFVLAVVAALLPADRAAAQAACTPSVKTAIGAQLCGKVDTRPDGTTANAFLGLRYADGARFMNSTLHTYPAAASVNATVPGPICPQLSIGKKPKTSCSALPAGQSEDCYFLNVWTPSSPPSSAAGYPVMVFIHGGAFALGAGSGKQYDGAHLASRGTVVVSFNYRLGTLGFLDLAGFTGKDQNNFGLRDQIVALDWVQQNIGSFGGDPKNVTIFGESAGAMSVGLHALFTAKAHPGYFKMAIMESNPLGVSYKTPSQAQTLGMQFAKQAGCSQSDPTTCLAGRPACALVQAETAVLEATLKTFTSQLAWAPIVDGSLITSQPMDAAKAGGFTVPVILGTNRDEGTLFSAVYLDLTEPNRIGRIKYKEILTSLFGSATTVYDFKTKGGAHPYRCPGFYPDCRGQLDSVLTAALFSCPNRELVQLAKSPAYAYLFAEVNPTCNPWTGVSKKCAKEVCHGAELPYVFTTPESIPSCTFPTGSAPLAISQGMGDLWASFASKGTPTTTVSGWPSWPTVSSPSPSYLVIAGNPATAATDPFESTAYPSYCDELWKGIGYGMPGQWDRLLKAVKRR